MCVKKKISKSAQSQFWLMYLVSLVRVLEPYSTSYMQGEKLQPCD